MAVAASWNARRLSRPVVASRSACVSMVRIWSRSDPYRRTKPVAKRASVTTSLTAAALARSGLPSASKIVWARSPTDAAANTSQERTRCGRRPLRSAVIVSAPIEIARARSALVANAWSVTGVDAKSDPRKIDPALTALATANPTRDFAVIVRGAAPKAKKDHPAARVKDAIDRAKGAFRHGLSIVGGASATLSGAAVLALSKDKDVSFISQDHVLSATFDPAQGAAAVTSPGVVEIGAPDAWTQYGVTGRGIGVAVLDSGIAAHPDLGVRLVASVDFTSGTPGEPLVAPADAGGH